MSFSIAIASGKGGTGKTTVAVSLFESLSARYADGVSLVDCDVEEPNDLLFFPDAEHIGTKQVTRKLPTILTDTCTFCRKCTEYCAFNAITVLPPAGFAEINPDLCHSCGACLYICPENAVLEVDDSYGSINTYELPKGFKLIEGRLKIGSTLQTMLIGELKKSSPPESVILILDAPPGTSCPVVETITRADFVILVTEPTPFGLHDLKLMLDLVTELGLPHGVIINKAGLGDQKSYDYLKEKGVMILGEIPFNQDIAMGYAEGKIPDLMRELQHNIFEGLYRVIEKQESR